MNEVIVSSDGVIENLLASNYDETHITCEYLNHLLPNIYIEAGDHVNLLKIQRDRYIRMMSGVPHDHISVNSGCSSPYHTNDTRFLQANA